MEKTTNTKKRFYAAHMYRSGDRVYAVIEGNLTHDVTLSVSQKGNQYIANSLGSGENDIARIARYAGMAIPEDVEIKTFVNIRVFSERAKEFEQHCKKGNHIIVAGYATYNEEYKNVTIIVDKFIVNPINDRYISDGIACFTNTYTNRAGDTVEHPELVLVPGTVSWVNDATTTTSNGSQMFRFSMDTMNHPAALMNAAINSKAKIEESDETGRLSVTAFGRVAERMAKILKKGAVVSVNGRIDKHANEESGKYYYNFTADDFNLISWPPRDQQNGEKTEENSSTPQRETTNENLDDEPEFTTMADDDDDDVPF